MTTQVSFKSKSGHPVTGAFAAPEGSGKVGSVVLIQEFWGVNDHIKAQVDRLAKEGFVVLAPDLYHGFTTTDRAEAAKHMQALDTLKAVDEIAGAMSFLKEHARANGKVGVTGFCLGGALALAAACHVPGIAAVVSYYGTPPDEKVDWSKATAPIMAHIAKRDDWVTPARAEDVKKKIESAGKTTMEVHLYEADHAFANDTRPEVHSPESSKLAWGRTVAFFHKHLA